MTDQETSLQNAFVTTLTAEMGPTDLTANVVSKGNLTSPCYLVIEMESDTQREYILFDDTFGASSFVASDGNRYLAGSAAGSNLTHPIGSSVQMVAMAQHFEDLNDRIDADAAVVAALDHGNDLAGLAGDDHTQYHNDARGDARYLQLGGGTLTGDLTLDADPDADLKAATKQYVDTKSRFILVWSFGIGEVELPDPVDGSEAFRWVAPFDCTVVSATPTAGKAPTGDSIDFEAKNEGSTMFSTKPTIAAGSKDGVKQTPSGNNALSATDVVTVYVTQVGSTTPGENVAIAFEIEV